MRAAVRAGPGAPVRPGDAQALLDRQAEVLELVARAAPLREVLLAILTSLEQLMPGCRCSVLLLDRDHRTLHHGAAPSLPERYVASIDGMAIGEGAGSCGTAVALNAAVVVRDVRTDPLWVDFRGVAEDVGLRSCWSTPIEGRDGLPVGTFAVYRSRPHRPTRREALLVDRFTHLAAVAIDHAGLLVDVDVVESEPRSRRPVDGDALGERPTSHAEPDVEVTVSRSDGPDGPDGSPAQHVVDVLDQTERRAAERDRRARAEAETARRTAEEHARARSDLLAAVCHDARTPIQAIVGFAELLRTLDLDRDRRREALDHIDAAARHVTDLLTDLLDLSRAEADALPLRPERVRVVEVVGEVLGLLSGEAARRRVSMRHDLADLTVDVDRRRFRQVLLNLVGNAVRHGRPGGHVVVRDGPSSSGTHLCLSVDDDGPGIPDELRSTLFTPFARGARRSGQEEGVGLGLGLAHGLMSAMGGEVAVGSTSTAGTSMVMWVPR